MSCRRRVNTTPPHTLHTHTHTPPPPPPPPPSPRPGETHDLCGQERAQLGDLNDTTWRTKQILSLRVARATVYISHLGDSELLDLRNFIKVPIDQTFRRV